MIANREVLEAAAESLPSAPPTERDLEIFAAVKVDCRRQVDVAAEFGISQSRVSQICRDVKLWRAGRGASAELEGRDQKVVEAWLDAQRLENLYEHTLELYRRSCQPKRRERKGANQHGEWHAETIDHQAGNLQCLRLAAQLLELRWKMEEKCPRPSPHALAHADESTFINRLISMRHWAEVRGEVPRGEEPGRLVKRLLAELLGRRELYPSVDPPEWDSTKAPTSGRGESQARVASPIHSDRESRGHSPNTLTTGQGFEKQRHEDGTQPATTGRGYAEPGAHTAHNISASGATYEPAGDAGGDGVNGWQDTSCIESVTPVEVGGEAIGVEEKRGTDMSGRRDGVGSLWPKETLDDGCSVPAKDSRPLEVCGYAEEERMALAELRRTFAVEIWPSMADQSVPTLLAEGQANLLLQGYTREQRRALLGWQRVMRMRKQGRAGG